MGDWHSDCGTRHCWAGWIVKLAGGEGELLEKETSTIFAAMQIFKKSNGKPIDPNWFFISNDAAMKKIKSLTES